MGKGHGPALDDPHNQEEFYTEKFGRQMSANGIFHPFNLDKMNEGNFLGIDRWKDKPVSLSKNKSLEKLVETRQFVFVFLNTV